MLKAGFQACVRMYGPWSIVWSYLGCVRLWIRINLTTFCRSITKTYHSYLISHMSVHHFLHHHCHHPLLFLTSTPGSTLKTHLFHKSYIVLLSFHPSGFGQRLAAKHILVHFRHKFAPFWVPKWRRIFCVCSPSNECGNYWELYVPVGLRISVRLCCPEAIQLKCPSS